MNTEELSPNALPFVDEEENDLRVVTPTHPIAHEAYAAVKAMRCEFVRIIASSYQKSPSETGYFISGIFPSDADRGLNREEWISTFERLKE
ncbi:hypothetical protein B9Y01_12260 [Acinetobacter baumannii]|uniref:hypothetical protein n=1 Tax=Acinetobacter calcoaceticus/baumannii complex TaxID=909768 RepID=UPI00044AEB99|nr:MULTISPECIES: hypothetical protein [Acinetobacter calcoaceticus/baumannii complex]EXE75536.1 hypothetical protein J582_3040 [Acinetobacter sp. 1566109]MBJ9959287.1 hypothetical protein [Acinetobacter nosocomialis]MBR7686162.1 hypothetical protein [Acinetobacter nosocomialis]MBR7701669.1 hypothetical protein [Acinetobacter nosocomialis]MBR7760875.1 hypothetical protein [Acinetobacter nosocomialis]